MRIDYRRKSTSDSVPSGKTRPLLERKEAGEPLTEIKSWIASIPASLPSEARPFPCGCTDYRQVFGLVGALGPILLAVPSQPMREPVLNDGFRSYLPLRGSPGFSPDSLFPRCLKYQRTDSSANPFIARSMSCQHKMWVLVLKDKPKH